MSYFPDDFLRELQKKSPIQQPEPELPPQKDNKIPSKKLIALLLIIVSFFILFIYFHYNKEKEVNKELKEKSTQFLSIAKPNSVIYKIVYNSSYLENTNLKEKEKLLQELKELEKLKEKEEELINQLKEKGKDKEEYQQLSKELVKIEEALIQIKRDLGLKNDRNKKILTTLSIYNVLSTGNNELNKKGVFKTKPIESLKENKELMDLCKRINATFCNIHNPS